MAWRAARSLLTLHRQLQAGAPRARPPATGADEWGLIGDAVHDPTSDHAPHDFPGWGKQIVTAADFPNRPDLGLDAWKVLDDIRRSRDPRAKYGISNGQIFSNHPVTEHGHSYGAWEWRPYLTSGGRKPADGHYTHGHLSVVGDARADGEQPWQTIGGPAATSTKAGTATGDEDDMGASFGPIEIRQSGETSLTIPPVRAGAADKRAAWINLNNAGDAKPYALRLWVSKGTSLEPFKLGGFDSQGMRVFNPGERWSWELEANTSGLYWSRKAVLQGPDGLKAVEPGTPGAADVNGAHLTLCIERGPVLPA